MGKGKVLTELLGHCYRGDKSRLDRLIPTIYRELYALAQRHMKNEPDGHILQATALVNEAYLKLVDADIQWVDRRHLFSITSTIMHRILVDHAKARQRLKRGGNIGHIEFDDSTCTDEATIYDVIDIDCLLKQLKLVDPRAGRIFELYTVGGLQREEIAEIENLSATTVDRDLRFSRDWVLSRLNATH